MSAERARVLLQSSMLVDVTVKIDDDENDDLPVRVHLKAREA
jgi:hypothetical protein